MDKFEEWYENNPEIDFYSRMGLAEAVWQHQQAKVEELQNRVDSLEKAEFKLVQVKAIIRNNPKLLESILIRKLEQALKGGDQ